MAGASQPQKVQTVLVVEANVLDRMNETRELVAQRAYEIYQSRSGADGTEQGDWFAAEEELLPKLEVESEVTDGEVRITTSVPGFDAKDLEVVVGHHEAVICGIHGDSKRLKDGIRQYKKVMQIIELPFDIDPAEATATLQRGTLRVHFPRAM